MLVHYRHIWYIMQQMLEAKKAYVVLWTTHHACSPPRKHLVHIKMRENQLWKWGMLVPQLTSGIFLTRRPISPWGRTPVIFCGTHSSRQRIVCNVQHFCGSLCNAGTLNDNDSGYTLRENTFQGPYVGQLRVGSQSMYNHLANAQNFH